MKKIKGTLVFELAVGQCAAIVEENNPNQVLRTSKVVTICSISADCQDPRVPHGTMGLSMSFWSSESKRAPLRGSFFALRLFGYNSKQCSPHYARFGERCQPQR